MRRIAIGLLSVGCLCISTARAQLPVPTSESVKKGLEQSAVPKDAKYTNGMTADIIGKVAYCRTFGTQTGSRFVFLVRTVKDAKYFYIDSDQNGADYEMKALFLALEKSWDVGIWANDPNEKSRATMVELYFAP